MSAPNRHPASRKAPHFSAESRAKLSASGGRTDRTELDKSERAVAIEDQWRRALAGWRFDMSLTALPKSE